MISLSPSLSCAISLSPSASHMHSIFVSLPLCLSYHRGKQTLSPLQTHSPPFNSLPNPEQISKLSHDGCVSYTASTKRACLAP